MDLEAQAIRRIHLAAELSAAYYQKPLLLAYSGGKDSEVCLELCRRAHNRSTRPVWRGSWPAHLKTEKGMISIDFTYTIQLTEAQYATLLDRAAELEIPLEDLLLQAMQNYLEEESDNFA